MRQLESVLQDLRQVARTLRRERGFAAIALLMLGLGLGANAAVFSVVEAIVLRPLPLARPQQLAWIAPHVTCGNSCSTYSAWAYEEFQQQAQAFSGIAGYFAFSPEANFRYSGRYAGGGQPTPATGFYVTQNFFEVLGVQPALGRLFDPADAQSGAPAVALLDHGYWRTHFRGDRNVVGRTILLNDKPFVVIGVLPPSFDFGMLFAPGEHVDLFTPYILDNWRDDGNDLALIGRIKPGIPLRAAQADVDRVMPELYFNPKYPQSKGVYKGRLTPLQTYVTGRWRAPLMLIWIAVAATLLIVCVNLSNLLLARAAARSREFAVRRALGAGRMRLVRQLVTESVVLSAGGAGLGCGVAFAITEFLAHQASIALPLLGEARLDGGALAWMLLLALLVAVVIGGAGGLYAASGALQGKLQASGGGAGGRQQRIRSGLVVAEVGLAAMLLIGAGLLLRSYLGVLDVQLGFEPARAASIKLTYDTNARGAQRDAIFERAIEAVQALPGVEAAGIGDFLPLGRNRSWGSFVPQGRQFAPGKAPSPLVYVVTPGFFRAMGIRLVAGRDFTWDDDPDHPEAVIINQGLANVLWPGGDAVGQLVGRKPALRVVGVVADVRETGLEGAAGWQAYYPAGQNGPDDAQLVIRSRRDAAALAPDVMAALRRLNPEQAASSLVPIQQIVDHATSPRRFFLEFVLAFGGFGLLMALLGLYGVIAYGVARRRREIGVRMALGATPAHIRSMVVRESLLLALAGVGLGVIGAGALTRLFSAMLFQVSPTDPLTFAATAAVLVGAALLAAHWPARRAAAVAPMAALRSE